MDVYKKISEKKIAVECVHLVYIQPIHPIILLNFSHFVEKSYSGWGWSPPPHSSIYVKDFISLIYFILLSNYKGENMNTQLLEMDIVVSEIIVYILNHCEQENSEAQMDNLLMDFYGYNGKVDDIPMIYPGVIPGVS